jgi:hypothetical protein
MISYRILAAVTLAALVVAAPAARGQYMYLDANGNGVHDAGDQLAPNGAPTTVDVWIITNHNRDGSLATCNVDGGLLLGINSYVVNLQASIGSSVSYTGFTTNFGDVAFGELNPGDGRYKNGFGMQQTLPPGTYRLASLTITGLAGNPQVDILDRVSGSSDFTMFGTGAGGCFGHDFDNTYKLSGPAGGSDWFDADGLSPFPIEAPPPVLAPIGNKTVNEGECLTFTATATTADQGPATFALFGAAPAGASITPGGQFSWCPTEAQGPGVYAIPICAFDSGSPQQSDCETIQVTVLEVNQGPVLAPIPDKTVSIPNTLDFNAVVTDADLPANVISYFIDPGFPAGVTISTLGRFVWTPATVGTYSVTIRVRDNGSPRLEDAKSFSIVVLPNEGTPVVQNPGAMSVLVPETLDRTVTATDPNGLPLTFTKSGDSPAFMTVTTTSPTTCNVHLAPTLADVGNYSAAVLASNGTMTGSASFSISVTPGCCGPFLFPIANMTVSEGDVADQSITAYNPGSPRLTFFTISGPPFMTVTTTGPTTGSIHLEPDFTNAGTYSATVRVTDGAYFNEKSFMITVLNVCQTPIAKAGGPYNGMVGIPVGFNGNASSDPDPGELGFAWNFGDGASGTGPTPSHTYASPGNYLVTLRVTNPCGLFGDATVTVMISDRCSDALAFAQGGDTKVALGSGKPQACIQLQPANGSFAVQDVDASSIVMAYQGNRIAATKSALGGDKNGDGVDEISLCFAKADLRVLFANLQGTQVVNVGIEGGLISGGRICSTNLDLTVKAGGGDNNASVWPNPLNPSAVLSFSTSRTGAVTVQLFDTQGRLVRTLMAEPSTAAGYHEVPIDGRDATGNRLASGIYFVKIHSIEGTEAKAITILK